MRVAMQDCKDVENEIFEEPCSRLEKPVQLTDLIEKCQDFTIRNMDEDEIEKSEETNMSLVYSFEELEPYCLPENLEPASDDEEDDPNYDEISKSFPVFRKKMHSITDDGKVMKLIDHESLGEKVPDGRQVVYYHYSAYVEFTDNPFDCSRLRQKKPVMNRLGDEEILPGLELAIRSMRVGEKAKFLVHPDLAFGEKGSPPRIPPRATILYDIELIDVREDMRSEDLKAEDRTFEQSIELAGKLRKKGNKMKTVEKNLNGAISAYRKGLQILIEASFDNDEKDRRRKKELLTFYSNLAVCYMEKKCFKLVCCMFNDARMDCGDAAVYQHAKLLYSSAKALKFLGDYEESLRRLVKANKVHPANESIVRELEAVNEAKKNYKNNEKRACLRMFGFASPDEVESQNDEDAEFVNVVSSDFKENIRQTLDVLKSSEKRHETLNADGFTYAEKRFIQRICVEQNFLFRSEGNAIRIIKRTV